MFKLTFPWNIGFALNLLCWLRTLEDIECDFFLLGVLLDDLLVAEDLAAAETTSAASHAAAANASNVQAGRLPGRYGFVDERTRQTIPEAAPDGAVVLGSPVAPPVNGDMYTDISTENAMLQGSR